MLSPVTPELLPANPETIARAGKALRDGHLVAFATETVYGLGADATNDQAVAAIFAAKGRPQFNPLIVHVLGREDAERYALFDARARTLAEAFWPGALTLVLPRRPDCPLSLLVSAGLDTVALRVPAHGDAQALLRAAQRPIAAPSANRSGKLSPTLASHVAASLSDGDGKLAMILDSGPAQVGLESTVVGLPLDGPATLLRPGGVPAEEIEKVLGGPLAAPAPPDSDTQGRSSPGQLESHYAPDAPLRLNATDVRPGEVLLGFGSPVPDGAAHMVNLSPSGDLAEAAARLFSALRDLDALAQGAPIAVMAIPERGLGRAINDRLRRAAAPRPA